MTDLVNISDFSYKDGLNIGNNNQSFSYLYGLSDFWQYLFQDTTSSNLLLETSSVQASDIYSKFLQLCSGISIEDITNSANSQLRLEIINDTPTLPFDVPILSGSWANGVTTLKVGDYSGFAVGDIIFVSGVNDIIVHDVGSGINTNPINSGGETQVISGSLWEGTFTISSIGLGGYISYIQPFTPGSFLSGGLVSTLSIGAQTYQLQDKIVSTRFIANRPFLPTLVLEEDVDFSIDPDTLRISFAKDLASYGFPSRMTSTGSNEYSLWFVDVRYDEDLIYEHFPKLLGRTVPRVSNEEYRKFIQGLYYIYTSGPSLLVIEKGINLVLGVPLARFDEEILEIRQYLNTQQYIVITDQNSYIIPSGLSPTVGIGDTLKVGDELSKWVEIIDNQRQPFWWHTYNVELPPELLPHVPAGFSRLITGVTGDFADWIMTNYLKNNVFLVKVNITQSEFLSIQRFESVSSILAEIKPTGVFPLYYYFDPETINITPVSATSQAVGIPGITNDKLLSGATSTSSPGIVL